MAESMAEEVLEQKEGNPGSDPKFQRFAATVERALKGFELSREWQDLISCLTRLNKVWMMEDMMVHVIVGVANW